MNYAVCPHGDGVFTCPCCGAERKAASSTKPVSPDQPGAAGTNPAKGEK